MDEEDIIELVEILTRQLESVGAGDIADELQYVEIDPDTDEPRVVPPLDQLVLMLQAFERYLAVRDGAVYDKAMTLIRERTRGAGPSGAFYEPTFGERELAPVPLSNIPHLTELREEVLSLIEEIKRSEPPSRRGR